MEFTNQKDTPAVSLCTILYLHLSPNYYPALTGGQLYKRGKRKDIDIVIYRNRQNVEPFEMVDIFKKLKGY